jgi:hypothetical protein
MLAVLAIQSSAPRECSQLGGARVSRESMVRRDTVSDRDPIQCMRVHRSTAGDARRRRRRRRRETDMA